MDLATGSRHLLDYWSIIVRRRWVVYLSVVSVTLAALVGSLVATPKFRATTTLQIERMTPDVLAMQDLTRTDYAWGAYEDYYHTQYKIIGSSPVARLAAERLELTSHPEFSPASAKPGLLSRLRSIIPRRRVARESDPLDAAATRLAAALEVTPVRNSQLAEVSWVSEDPDLAARVANAIASAYIQFSIEIQHTTSDEAEEFLVEQIGMLGREISKTEERLQDYSEMKRIVSIDDTSNITIQALQDISQRKTVAQTVLAKTEAAYHSVLASSPDALTEVKDSNLISRLRQEFALYEIEYSETARQFGENWPETQILLDKLKQSQARIEEETARIVAHVTAARQAAYDESAREVKRLDQLLREHEDAAQLKKRDSVQFALLQGDVTKKRETLNALMLRQNEIALSSRLKTLDTSHSNIRVMEPARVPTAPFQPRPLTNVALGLILGLSIGVCGALFLEYIDNTLNSPADLQRITTFPVLAVVPRHRATDDVPSRGRPRVRAVPAGRFDFVTELDGRSEAAEAYRGLRTSILLSNPGTPPGRIMISSALPGEGKTATAINLAIVLAQLGRRVLLVDTDLRKPRLHKAFGVENRHGVSTYLSGLETDPTRLLQETTISHLDLMCSGPIPPNPSELLNSTTFAEMGRALLDRGFDHVLFDSPPVLSVSDPVIISSVVDSGVLVVRAGKTPRQSLRLAAGKFQQAGTTSFGVLLNDLDTSLPSGSYGYHYYGRYGEEDGPTETNDKDEQAHDVGA